MRKFYLTLIIIIMAFAGSFAQTGDYLGTAHIGGKAGLVDTIVPNVTVSFQFSGDDYWLSVRDINFIGTVLSMDIHNVVVSEIDGGWKLEKQGFQALNILSLWVPTLGGSWVEYTNIPAKVILDNGSIIDEILYLDLNVNFQLLNVPPFNQTYVVDCPVVYQSYPPVVEPVSISKTSNNDIFIYPTLVRDGNLHVEGLDAAVGYSVYSFTGSLVKSGVTPGIVDVGSLNKGLYILHVAGKITKFCIN